MNARDRVNISALIDFIDIGDSHVDCFFVCLVNILWEIGAHSDLGKLPQCFTKKSVGWGGGVDSVQQLNNWVSLNGLDSPNDGRIISIG